jgi:hypothetical protein
MACVAGASYHCRLHGVKLFATHQHGFVLQMARLFFTLLNPSALLFDTIVSKNATV